MTRASQGFMEGKGTMNWNGAGGTRWWYDPQNDVTFMVQRLRGGVEREELATTTRTLTYQALTHPER